MTGSDFARMFCIMQRIGSTAGHTGRRFCLCWHCRDCNNKMEKQLCTWAYCTSLCLLSLACSQTQTVKVTNCKATFAKMCRIHAAIHQFLSSRINTPVSSNMMPQHGIVTMFRLLIEWFEHSCHGLHLQKALVGFSNVSRQIQTLESCWWI